MLERSKGLENLREGGWFLSGRYICVLFSEQTNKVANKIMRSFHEAEEVRFLDRIQSHGTQYKPHMSISLKVCFQDVPRTLYQ